MSVPGAPRVLVVDDEPQIHRFLGPALEAAGYEPLRADTAAEGLRLAAERSPALVLLDLGLPDMDGKLGDPAPARLQQRADRRALGPGPGSGEGRRRSTPAPTTMWRSPSRWASCWRALRAALRRAAAAAGPDAPEPVVRVGPLEVDLARRLARVDGGEPLKLTPREWDLLAALARAGAGRVVTQRQLLTAVWGPAHAEDAQYLRVYVGHLRQKLGAAARLIRTEPGVGYRFGEAE